MIKTNILASCILLALDILWVSLYMSREYKKQIKDIQGTEMKTRLYFGAIAYILMVVGLNMFVMPNIRKNHELLDSLKYGATFGLVIYGIYDMTAGAVFKDWNMSLAILDIIWGSFVFFISAYIGSKVGSKL
tara:strand:- start:393 stop:788 length:396 start_codon:yes stop_codon:yes gene_type:complete